jgi:hypothetical protein
MLVALRKQVQTGQRVTVPARVEDQATRFRVRPAEDRQPPAWTRWRCSSAAGVRLRWPGLLQYQANRRSSSAVWGPLGSSSADRPRCPRAERRRALGPWRDPLRGSGSSP